MADNTGSCLCGTVTYEFAGDPMMTGYCHCSRCRRMTGAAAEPAFLIPTSQLNVKSGKDNVQVYESDGFVNRSFCKTCGSTMFSYQWPDGPLTAISMGSLDGDPGFAPRVHIHVASKAAWHEITDDLPQFAALPDK